MTSDTDTAVGAGRRRKPAEPVQDPAAREEAMLRHERALWRREFHLVAGVDEAGRGPLAGPVVAAAVIFPPGVYSPEVDDSKKLTPLKREELFSWIMENAFAVGIGVVDHETIDRINILNATFAAMRTAVDTLGITPEHLLVDGNRFAGSGPLPFSTIIGGDGCCFSIAAASIIAKVTRDRMMVELDARYPGYGFAQHKGYCTREHLDAIRRLGICPIHRRSFRWQGCTEEEEP